MRIEYRDGKRPRAFIEEPALGAREGERIPHIYGPDEPCFFYPKHREWVPSMRIASSVLPWLEMWLVFYEVWRTTGVWHGGGVDHAPRAGRDDA